MEDANSKKTNKEESKVHGNGFLRLNFGQFLELLFHD